MDILISIIVAGILIYLLLKLSLYFYRPFYFSKLIKKTEDMYNVVLSQTKREVVSASEDLNKWWSDGKIPLIPDHENQLQERIKAAKSAQIHEEEVHKKFLRLKERFIQTRDKRGNPDYIKLADLVTTYQRYLEVRLNQIRFFANAVILLNTISFEEMVASNNETLIILQENERKLDKLLAE